LRLHFAFALFWQALLPFDPKHPDPQKQNNTGKILRDPLYNYIRLTPAAAAALDTPPLQRLRHLKQLGCASAVYPTAEHSRFAHSLGVAHLAANMVEHLHEAQPALELRPEDATTLELAGLLHDVGHGPFSHVFEAEFLQPLGVEWCVGVFFSVDFLASYVVDSPATTTQPTIQTYNSPPLP
jgi:HD superfamily phosphohydrolase